MLVIRGFRVDEFMSVVLFVEDSETKLQIQIAIRNFYIVFRLYSEKDRKCTAGYARRK